MRSVFTIATGSQIYLEYAFTLARSFLLNHHDSDIKFFIITDLCIQKPKKLEAIEIIYIAHGSIPEGISSKLFLDRLAPTEKSLFIDSDCLCFRNLESIFERFDGRSVSVVGFPISRGEWCGALAEDVCRRFSLDRIPRFNGGIYYIEKGTKATKIYDYARNLETHYDELGFTRHRGWCNEEPLMSIAMARFSEEALFDDGTTLSDLASCSNSVDLDILSGKCLLKNPMPPDPRNKWWYQFSEYSPAVIHFSGGESTSYPYTRERFKLLLAARMGKLIWVVQFLGVILFTFPFKIKNFIRMVLRPIYRKLFGYRNIKPSNRPYAPHEKANQN